MTTPHEILNPPELAAPQGFSHAVVSGPGRTIYLGGQIGCDTEGRLLGTSIAKQFDAAAANVVVALAAAGAAPEHLVSMQIFVTDLAEYRDALADVGRRYRAHFGSHYPAVALFEVNGLFEPGAKVELVCTAVIPAP